MRRQKCDRDQPCSRCVKRGEPDRCTREWPKEGYDPSIHRTYPRPSKSNDSEVFAEEKPSIHTHHENQRDPAPTDPLPLGPNSLQDYQAKSFELLREPWKNNGGKEDQPEFSNGFGKSSIAQLAYLQSLLPRREQAFQLVEYHIHNVLWYNVNFHGDTFLRELAQNYDRPGGLQIREVDLRWVALLFAVLAGTMTCTSDQDTVAWGVSHGERGNLSRQWYKASVNCLNLADYTWRHHLNSVQAICVLTLSAHTLGFSNTHTTLLGSVIKMAQGLGMHRLELEPEEIIPSSVPITDTAKRDRVLRREIGRRLWQQICTQDWFSIPFSEMYLIQHKHFTSLPPQHIDEETLLPISPHEPALVSFSKCAKEIAAIMPEHHDSLLTATTLYQKYEQVLHYDARLKALATEGLPTYFSHNTPIMPYWPGWVSWARRSLRITVAHKIIMIHRAFLGRSFSDATFGYTRRASLEAATIIIQEVSHFFDQGTGPAIWVDQAHMVAAGITLSLDTFHRQAADPKLEEHRQLVELAITMLGRFNTSMIAIRGVRLLSSLLTEQTRLTASQVISDTGRKKRSMDLTSTESADDSAHSRNPASTSPDPTNTTTTSQKRAKFDIPHFVQNFVGCNPNLTESLANGIATSTTSQIYETAHNILNGRIPGPFSSSFTGSNNNNNNTNSHHMHGGFGGNTNSHIVPSLPMQNMNLLDTTPQQAQIHDIHTGYETNMATDTTTTTTPESALASTNNTTADPASAAVDNTIPSDFFEYNYAAFDEIFPPQAGISNDFLFGDLLNFEL